MNGRSAFRRLSSWGRKEARNNLMKEGSDPMCKDGQTDGRPTVEQRESERADGSE